METTVIINRENIGDIYEKFLGSVESKDYIISMAFPDAEHWTQDDLDKYAQELQKVKTYIINECKSGGEFIPFYPFIDNLLSEENKYDPNLIVCSKCPCRSCIQDRALFEQKTGANNIPYPEFCKRAFVDYEIFVEICEELQIQSPPKISCQEYWQLVLESLANNKEGVDQLGL